MLDFVPFALFERDLGEAARRLGESFRATGFAIVDGHGIPSAVVGRAMAEAKAFFARPAAEKRAAHVPGTGGARGYTPFGIETAKGSDLYDLKEFYHVGRELPEGHPLRPLMPPNVWPDGQPGFRDAALELFAALEGVGRTLLRAIAVHLGQPADFFEPAVHEGNSVLRFLHYPPVPEDVPHLRAAPHEDINVITLLLGAEEGGLQLKTPEGAWHDVTPPEGALVVNVGDMLERQTGGLLRSTTHRVVNPPPERRHVARYSAPFFLHFRPDWRIEPLVAHPEMPPILAHDFLLQRLKEIRLT
ncbi:MAG: isopenicillin N synthase family oxygenase [Sphingomonadaceae bacterium]|nr:isopenicillin N synthase family oxygenase [Sphingomonadaceae bacterium]